MAQAISRSGGHTVEYLSAFNIIKPVKRNKLFMRYGDQGLGLFNLIDTLGYYEPCANRDFSHFEHGWIHESFKVKTNVSDPGAGVEALVTIHADNVDGDNNFYPQEKDQVIFKNEVVGTVASVNVSTPTAPVLTIEPNESTDNIGALTAGDTISIYSNSYEEGSQSGPDTRITKEDEYEFGMKIIRGAGKTSGTAMATEDWFTETSDGKSIPAKYMLSDFEEEYRMMLRIEGALWAGRPVTNSAISDHDDMQGVVPWVRNGGNVGDYQKGLWGMQNFNVMKNTLDRSFAPDEMFGQLGSALYTEVEDAMVDYLDNGALVYGSSSTGRSAEDINIHFKTFSKGNRKYHITENKLLNHPQLFGAAGHEWSSKGLFCPIDKRKKGSNKQAIPAMAVKYLSLGDMNRKMKIWETGGMAPSNKTNEDARVINMLTECGAEWFASNRFYLWELQ